MEPATAEVLPIIEKPDLRKMKAKIDEISNGILKLKEHRKGLLEKQRASRENLRNVAKTIAGEKADAIVAGDMSGVDSLQAALQESKDAAQGIAEDIDACNQGIETRKAEVGLLKTAYRNAYRAEEHRLIGGSLEKDEAKFLDVMIDVLAKRSIDIGTLVNVDGMINRLTEGKSQLAGRVTERMAVIRKNIGAKI